MSVAAGPAGDTARRQAPDEIRVLEDRITQKLREYGSPELLADLVIFETIAQHPAVHDPRNPLAEAGFAAYAAGLFLGNSNYCGEPSQRQVEEILLLLGIYVRRFWPSLIPLDAGARTDGAYVKFLSKILKIQNDANPQSYLGQKSDYHRDVLSPMNTHFLRRYGFSADFARKFARNFTKRIDTRLLHKLKSITGGMSGFEFYANSRHILEIDVARPGKYGIRDGAMLQKLLDHISCSHGDQTAGFRDLLSENVISHKPVIRTADGRFLAAKPDFLRYKLDMVLERLIMDSGDPEMKARFTGLRSKYLERKTHSLLARAFPKGSVFRNAHYLHKSELREVDILVKYGSKILIIESKSGAVASRRVVDGRGDVIGRLGGVLGEAVDQCTTAMDYIRSSEKAVFWRDRSRKEVLVEVDDPGSCELLPVVVMMRQLGMIGTDLGNIESLDLFAKGYPWLVYLYDLDVVTDMLREPDILVDYMRQRIEAQGTDKYSAGSEQALLSYFMQNGSFGQYSSDPRIARISLGADYMDPIEAYYSLNRKKPAPVVPGRQVPR